MDVCANCVCIDCDFSCANIIGGKCCLCRGANKSCGVEHCKNQDELDKEQDKFEEGLLK